VLSRAAAWDLQTATQWLTGSLNGASWDSVAPVAIACAVLIPAFLSQERNLALLRFGDDSAASLGVRVQPTRVVLVLAAAGLLAGKRATTHWRYSEKLRELYPDITVVPDVLYIDEGDVLTSAGSAAGIDLCLHLVRRDFGTKAANMVARRLVVPPHRDGGQAQYVESSVPEPHERSRLGPLIDRMRADISADYPVAVLADLAGMSERTFLRRFAAATGVTPARWLLSERLSRARALLEDTAMPIERIAETAGLGAAGTLRHHFRQQFATTPVAYRARFGAKSA
jgi:AraC family transcriptional activator FtrA